MTQLISPSLSWSFSAYCSELYRLSWHVAMSELSETAGVREPRFQAGVVLWLTYCLPRVHDTRDLGQLWGEYEQTGPPALSWSKLPGVRKFRQHFQELWSSDVESSDLKSLTEEVRLRIGPIREQWEARGPGLLRALKQRLPWLQLPRSMRIQLVTPVFGGGGLAHAGHARLTFEGVLANSWPTLPEVARLGWLIAQLALHETVATDAGVRQQLSAFGFANGESANDELANGEVSECEYDASPRSSADTRRCAALRNGATPAWLICPLLESAEDVGLLTASAETFSLASNAWATPPLPDAADDSQNLAGARWQQWMELRSSVRSLSPGANDNEPLP